jgi:hypothetical protein
MRVLAVLPFAAVATLAACNSSPTVTATNASSQEVAAKMAAAGTVETISPGRWEGTMHIAEMTMPGLPPEAQAKLAAARGDTQIVSCVTAEDVKDSKASMFGAMGDNCKYDHFAMGGGKIDGVATCDNGGAKTKTTISGTFSSDSYQMAIRSESTGKGPMENMTMAMTANAKRVGECRGTPDEKD